MMFVVYHGKKDNSNNIAVMSGCEYFKEETKCYEPLIK